MHHNNKVCREKTYKTVIKLTFVKYIHNETKITLFFQPCGIIICKQ